MTRYSKFNIVYRLQKWMDSVPGQTFLNYAYSWGASIVILGTLFKLTHLPGANFFLFLGMGTEVFVFFISAFDRPFDKTADGMDLPTHLREHENEEESEVQTDEEGNPQYTADAPGYWLGCDGQRVSWGEEAIVYLNLVTSEETLEFYTGNHPENCNPAGQTIKTKMIIEKGDITATYNVTIDIKAAAATR